MTRPVRAVLLGVALALASPPTGLAAQPIATLQQWQAREARLFAIGWRLATGNAPFCANAAPAIGLLLHDANAYRDPPAARTALQLSGPIGVQAVAAGSPAARTGLRVNDTLLSIGDTELGRLPVDRAKAWLRLAGINTTLDQSLARGAGVTLRWRSPDGAVGEAAVPGVPACAARFELLSGSDRVSADGSRVLLGERFAGFAYSDELLAAAVAHELAHNLLGHRARLDRQGRSQANIRTTEREADRMMPWLLANAGYPPDAAVRFMQRWGPDSASGRFGGLLRARSHDGWDERAALITAELPLVARALAADGLADWRARFPAAAR